MRAVIASGWEVLTWVMRVTGSGLTLENQFLTSFGTQVVTVILKSFIVLWNISGEPSGGISNGCMFAYISKAYDYPCDGATQNYPLCQIPL